MRPGVGITPASGCLASAPGGTLSHLTNTVGMNAGTRSSKSSIAAGMISEILQWGALAGNASGPAVIGCRWRCALLHPGQLLPGQGLRRAGSPSRIFGIARGARFSAIFSFVRPGTLGFQVSRSFLGLPLTSYRFPHILWERMWDRKGWLHAQADSP